MNKTRVGVLLIILLFAGVLVAQQPTNIFQWSSTGLAVPTAYGTPPSGNVIGVNAYVTTLPAITGAVSLSASTSGGTSDYHAVCAGSTNVANIKASAGQIYSYNIFNNTTYPVFVKFYNTSGTPTAGTGVVWTVGDQAGLPATGGPLTTGQVFTTGIGISVTKGIADSDATATLANDCVVDVQYK